MLEWFPEAHMCLSRRGGKSLRGAHRVLSPSGGGMSTMNKCQQNLHLSLRCTSLCSSYRSYICVCVCVFNLSLLVFFTLFLYHCCLYITVWFSYQYKYFTYSILMTLYKTWERNVLTFKTFSIWRVSVEFGNITKIFIVCIG